jgi:RNA polymerase sigma factor (sigma-70 family)
VHELRRENHVKPARGSLDREVAAYIAGDDAAGERICSSLEPVIRAEVRRFLPESDADHDDIVQETLFGLITYLRKAGRGPDCLEAFVVTMAGNRCRNLYRWRKRRPSVDMESASEWLRADGDDPLEELEAEELERTVRQALDRLDPPCRKLLLDIYTQRRSMQDVQKEAGLRTVQGAYYRKYACLKKLAALLNQGGLRGQQSGSESSEWSAPTRGRNEG